MAPRSGNFLVDAQDDLEEIEAREHMECGCNKYCKCDSAWDERE